MAGVLGLDSGGTKTLAAIADRSGRIIASTQGAGLDPTTGDDWEQRFADMAAFSGQVESAVLGLPFHGEIPDVSARQSALALSLFGPKARVLNDVAIAFEGALAGSEGVLILAGTGSMAWARGPRGTRRVGGWGNAFGDEGSAFWIGREALGLVSQHLDGRRSDAAFAEGLLEALRLAAGDLIDWTYRQVNLRAAIASLAALVSQRAATGCATALALMTRAAGHLALLGLTAAAACGVPLPVRWSYAGGAFNDPTLLSATIAGMQSVPMPPRLPPVGGAILTAARDAGWVTDDSFIQRLNDSLATELQRQIET